ncbi:MAG: hypothetical protein J6D10_09800 [Clostridia bacterium]|nr:hypothetical protein [Clostridia bacterium]
MYFSAQTVAAEETERGLVGFGIASERDERDSGCGDIRDDLRTGDEFAERPVEIGNIKLISKIFHHEPKKTKNTKTHLKEF